MKIKSKSERITITPQDFMGYGDTEDNERNWERN